MRNTRFVPKFYLTFYEQLGQVAQFYWSFKMGGNVYVFRGMGNYSPRWGRGQLWVFHVEVLWRAHGSNVYWTLHHCNSWRM